MNLVRQVVAYKNYFLDFYTEQTDSVQAKIEWTLNLIRVTRQVPEKYFKHIESKKGLYEVRVEVGGNIYRIFSFFDKGNLVVLGNAFQKKTQKTPKREIERALKIMEEYSNEK
ncbi:MAG: addiction module toxin RelE [Bacteroidetes bacterium CG02_land_8_20_14_3_00_31_25]|nr:type II toxin-antitoxin system RelE/ParE family toxin [Bacteroidota bacterium]OFX36033.1 MAG: addiction module toxin RelE [Bacteroidetes bacterium GWA2_32_17]PIV58810.1 MAG: addiction module toxin RelE [Bacteroidetes bacterium CG02_land_8_20_14_3_00_31_25]PIX32908.1 MAG: addiction module toxin RelE [Bacteroidetes bacterium CG_4_8_14_3_um_filter_31_14]PIY02365.1 MAG: addiction module toxin RelE [Bacteroidetes bacterium CG_4_10_14_3_um_filter_31_20]